MTTFVILLLVMAAGLVALAVRRKLSAEKVKRPPQQQNPFAALSIVFDEASACPEVMKYSGQRLLSREAPKLPLPNCSAKKCTCSFHHFSDRRKAARRADETGIIEEPYVGPDRRLESRGRRADDRPAGQDPAPTETKDPHADTYFDFHKKTGAF